MRNNKTLLGKLGFDDNDSKTPKHDEILNLIMKDSVISKIANMLKLIYKDERGKFKQMIFDDNDNWSKNEEFILKTKTNFVVGAIDLHVCITKDTQKVPIDGCDNFICEGMSGPCLLTNKQCQYVNRFDLCSSYEGYAIESENYKINIEVKGDINSVGQLIRQVNVYREFDRTNPFVVIAPYIEESYRNRLIEANIFPISMDELGLPTVWCEQFTDKGFDGHFIFNKI